MEKFESRLGYDGAEGFYFDRARPVVVEGVTRFEECCPTEVCDELQAALEWYANEMNYNYASDAEDQTIISQDQGGIARAALPAPSPPKRRTLED